MLTRLQIITRSGSDHSTCWLRGVIPPIAGDSFYSFRSMFAIFSSAKEQFEGGYLFSIQNLAKADVFEDELEQASYFLKANWKVPAAVIAGTVLESSLRTICEQTDEVEPSENINNMNNSLKASGVFNAGRHKLITAWADIRNNAAHGHPDEFD